MVAERQIQLTGNILCLPKIRPPKAAMNWIPHGGKRDRGRPLKTLRATVNEDLQRGSTNWYQTSKTIQDQLRWNQTVDRCCTKTEGTRY